MGTKMSPSYANLFMGKIEKQLQNLGKPHIHTWKRFIDDIFVIWTCSKEDFHTYMEQINQIHDTIKFTYAASNTEVTFLDVTVYKGEKFTSTGILDVRTHIKPTNKQLYVHASSYHSPTTKKAIAKGEAKRFLRTNSTESTYQEMLNKLIIKLKERGYKKQDILRQTKCTKFETRKLELKRKTKTTKQGITFITRYCDDIPSIRKIILDNWHIIQKKQSLKNIFTEKPIIGLRRNPNLRQKLVRAKLKPTTPSDPNPTPNLNPTPTPTPNPNTNSNPTPNTNPNPTPNPNPNPNPNPSPNTNPNPTPKPNSNPNPKLTTQSHNTNHSTQPLIPSNYPWNLFEHKQKIKRCGLRNCLICPKLSTKNFIQSKTNGMKFPIINNSKLLTCNTAGVVYCIECTRCGEQYVGQTQRKLKSRLSEHLDPRHNPDQALKKHYLRTPKHTRGNMRFQILEYIGHQTSKELTIQKLLHAETKWIKNFQTILPHGLNIIESDNHIRR